MNESRFQKLLKIVLENNCEEAKLQAGAPPIVRIHDRQVRLEAARVTLQDLSGIAHAIAPTENLRELMTQGNTRFVYMTAEGICFEIVIEANGTISAAPIKSGL
jgi:Tfp pilus assembly pilus retraction ATPase PilT